MARKKTSTSNPNAKTRTKRKTTVEDYRHDEAKRKNNLPAKIAAEGTVPAIPKAQYAYSPRRNPRLLWDTSGKSDKLTDLLAEARQRTLTEDETRELADALQQSQPWLEWADKREQHQRGFFDVDPVALHIHERISAQAILKVAARQDVQRSLFADPEAFHTCVAYEPETRNGGIGAVQPSLDQEDQDMAIIRTNPAPSLKCEGYGRQPHSIAKGSRAFKCADGDCEHFQIVYCSNCWEAHNEEMHDSEGEFQRLES